MLEKVPPHVRESGIRNPAIFGCWNPESRGLESGTTMVWNPESTMVWNPESRKLESGIERPGSGIQDLHGFSYTGRKVYVFILRMTLIKVQIPNQVWPETKESLECSSSQGEFTSRYKGTSMAKESKGMANLTLIV